MPTAHLDSGHFNYDHNPDNCPICHHAVDPRVLKEIITGRDGERGTLLEIAFQCPRRTCLHIFIGRYHQTQTVGGMCMAGDYMLKDTQPKSYLEPDLSSEVVSISPSFKVIYGQAAQAESLGLGEIAGVGYRKSLEFLMKDFCIHKNPTKEDAIKKSPLAQVIKNHVTAQNIKDCAEKAAWLGNDETHYERTWKCKDISDLKQLIKLTCIWVESDLLTEKYMTEMSRK